MTGQTSTYLSAAAVTLLVGLLAACAAAPPETPSERRADDQVETQVETALSADPNIFARHIDVRVDRGVVHLEGFVWEAQDVLRARHDALAVPGVRLVDTEMELFRGGMGGSR
jgi:osmotically-inducible protein OsmY